MKWKDDFCIPCISDKETEKIREIEVLHHCDFTKNTAIKKRSKTDFEGLEKS